VNFVTAHDGFTLADLVSYNEKHNEANGEGNRDGHDDNRSYNWGVEGATDDPDILDMRDRIRRNLMATLLVSQGTPMILMGDEVSRTQFGNNNAYCQDTEMSWLAWSEDERNGQGERDQAFLAFTRGLLAIRRDLGLFNQSRFLHGKLVPGLEEGVRDVCWLRPDGQEMGEADWHAHDPKVLAMVLADAQGRRAIVFVNGAPEDVTFALPEPLAALQWTDLFSTADGTIYGVDEGPIVEPPFHVEQRAVLAVLGRA
jgi:glycogen operon protein